jgi:hypothetical protein
MPIEEDGLDRASKCAIEHAAFSAHGAIAQVTSRTRARLLAFELRCGRSSEAEQQPSRLEGWVRFPPPAPKGCRSLAMRTELYGGAQPVQGLATLRVQLRPFRSCAAGVRSLGGNVYESLRPSGGGAFRHAAAHKRL